MKELAGLMISDLAKEVCQGNHSKALPNGSCSLDLAYYGSEASQKLVETMASTIAETEQDIDALIVNGDFPKHGDALEGTFAASDIAPAWETIKDTIDQNMKTLRKSFPGKLILPTIGNNDVIVHNQMPCTQGEHDKYFSELFDVWFAEQPAGFDREAARETFLVGGYYRHQFADSKTTLLALNSMYWKLDNECELDIAEQQMNWLEE